MKGRMDQVSPDCRPTLGYVYSRWTCWCLGIKRVRVKLLAPEVAKMDPLVQLVRRQALPEPIDVDDRDLETAHICTYASSPVLL
jgi:hypothetical protein